MTLQKLFTRQGEWLFQHRSYMPLTLTPLLLLTFAYTEPIIQAANPAFISVFRTLCILISGTGLLIRILIVGFVPKGTSGRNTGGQKANALNTTGIYSIVRHPLYLANFMIYLGLVMYTLVWWLMLISILAFIAYYERIMAREEEFLQEKFGESFTQWAERTPAFFPNLKLWKKPDLRFSLKSVLKREHSTFMTMITAFTFTHYGADFFGNFRFESGFGWLVAFLLTFALFYTLRTLKKKKKLSVEGR
ncbi:MAG: isoprenylcysteine carboxylmethyltransferase family protein [candidate division KSB1 bacterium]|nr:isoprenylcysteine carboxylmethyltransferase family protein [candidate division KSB1 bacterium]